jgi:hypothetical protein
MSVVGTVVALGLIFGGFGASQTYAQQAATGSAAAVAQAPKNDRCPSEEHCGRAPLARALAKETLAQTGLTKAQLAEELKAGKSLAQVAGANGSSEQAVVDAVMAKITARLDKAVANGKITPEKKAEILARAAERSHEIMNKTKPN